jgi:hypothetical protein
MNIHSESISERVSRWPEGEAGALATRRRGQTDALAPTIAPSPTASNPWVSDHQLTVPAADRPYFDIQ